MDSPSAAIGTAGRVRRERCGDAEPEIHLAAGVAAGRAIDDHQRRIAAIGAREQHEVAKRLGDIYDKGLIGITRDYAESLKWYNAARVLGCDVPLQQRRG